MTKTVGERRLKNKKDVIQFLKECKDIHKWYFKHPRYCRGNVGSSKFHEMVYYQYQDAIDILGDKK